MKYLEQSEHQIQSAILEHLRYWDVLAWRQNSGRFFVKHGNRTNIVIGAPTGSPDIIGVLGKSYGRFYGRMLGIEVKKPSKMTTEAQNRIIEELLAFGAYVFVAYSVDDVEEQLERLKKG